MKFPGMTWLDNFVNEALNVSIIKIAEKTDRTLFINQIKKFREKYPKFLYEKIKDINLPYLSSPRDLDEIYVEMYAFRTLLQNRLDVLEKIDRTQASEIISSNKKLLLLGEPGAGKTTLLRRLAYSCTVEETSLKYFNENNLFPIYLECRGQELKDAYDEYEFRKEEIRVKRNELSKTRNREYVKNAIPDLSPVTLLVIWLSTELSKYKLNYPESFVNSLLKTYRILILIDGLDEIQVSLRREISCQIDCLCTEYSDVRLIASCRSSEQKYLPRRLNLCEVAPLNETQKKLFVEKWFENPKAYKQFLDKAQDTHIWEITDRPLLLSMLCALFKDGNELPKYKVDIYRECIELALRKWDAYRNISRETKFDELSTNQKINVLAYIASIMSLRDITQIRVGELIDIIEVAMEENSISGDAKNLATEISSHSGLLVQTHVSRYSYSHKSFQEFFSSVFFSQSDPNLPCNKYHEDRQWYPIMEMTSCLVTDASKPLMQMTKGIEKKINQDCYVAVDLYQMLNTNPFTISIKGRVKLARRLLRSIKMSDDDLVAITIVDQNIFDISKIGILFSLGVKHVNHFGISKEKVIIAGYNTIINEEIPEDYVYIFYSLYILLISSPKALNKIISTDSHGWRKSFLLSIEINSRPVLKKSEYKKCSSVERRLREVFSLGYIY